MSGKRLAVIGVIGLLAVGGGIAGGLLATRDGGRVSAPLVHVVLSPRGPHWFGPGGSFGSPLDTRQHPRTLGGAVFLDLNRLANPQEIQGYTSQAPIMPSTATYAVFWLPTSGPGAPHHFSNGAVPGDASSDATYETEIGRYFKDVGGSPFLGVVTQYPGRNGTPTATSTYAGSAVDTAPFPHAGTVADPLTDADVADELYRQISAHGWPSGLRTMYFVFLPGVLTCLAQGFCNGPGRAGKFCGYHSSFTQNGRTYVYSNIPDGLAPVEAGCLSTASLSGNDSADTVLTVVAHEHIEAITDPLGNGWKDPSGSEIGDKCYVALGVAGTALITSSQPNNYLGSGGADPFRLQRLWSNATTAGTAHDTACAASYSRAGSHVLGPGVTAADVSAAPEATLPAGGAGTLHYAVSFHNPSGQDDALDIHVTVQLPAGVRSGGAATVNEALGDLGPHQTATAGFTAQLAGPRAAGAVLRSSSTFTFRDSTGAALPPITKSATTTVAG